MMLQEGDLEATMINTHNNQPTSDACGPTWRITAKKLSYASDRALATYMEKRIVLDLWIIGEESDDASSSAKLMLTRDVELWHRISCWTMILIMP